MLERGFWGKMLFIDHFLNKRLCKCTTKLSNTTRIDSYYPELRLRLARGYQCLTPSACIFSTAGSCHFYSRRVAEWLL